MHPKSFHQLLKTEFHNYQKSDLRADFLAGLTVASVSLPLALAFGIASGATASAGLITAILAGCIIGLLSGAAYQISGPTGAMSAVLIVVAHKYGIQAVLAAGAISGCILILLGYFRLGRFISFIPSPVIVGFTSGIALIIAVGQIDSIFGIRTEQAGTAVATLQKFLSSAQVEFSNSVLIATSIILLMTFWPQKLAKNFPISLLAIIVATVCNYYFELAAPIVGEIPKTLILENRLRWNQLLEIDFTNLVMPIFAITALGAIESLLCGSVGSAATGKRLYANQELIAQGVGNLVVPFCGGVPATAAIARTSVAIKAGGKTRLVSVFQSLFLLATVLFFAPIMSQIPLSALAGVLLVTAWRMNDWHSIRFYFKHSMYSAIVPFIITLLATFCLDLTEAIIIGTLVSAIIFVTQAAKISITVSNVESDKLKLSELPSAEVYSETKVVYLSGLLFFAAASSLNEALSQLYSARAVVLSIRGVPQIDASCFEIIEKLRKELHSRESLLLFAGTTEAVYQFFERVGFAKDLGSDNFYWSTDQALRGLAARVVA